jgi:hypothetical protein
MFCCRLHDSQNHDNLIPALSSVRFPCGLNSSQKILFHPRPFSAGVSFLPAILAPQLSRRGIYDLENLDARKRRFLALFSGLA